ncbi:hypothetical protein [Mechercharimyces sp. CAU 1602]|nr:hypothetical protein [Mechercharimyces sp. CAU 1602]MCS1351313.1 hypothetical protein [Mechercharimyces sp. CAU 1602]
MAVNNTKTKEHENDFLDMVKFTVLWFAVFFGMAVVATVLEFFV